jgi:hypothetical protein
MVVFIFVIRPEETSFRVLFKFGLETDQFFEVKLLKSMSDRDGDSVTQWIIDSGLAWMLVSELNMKAVRDHSCRTGNLFLYKFGRDALASLILAMRQAKNP